MTPGQCHQSGHDAEGPFSDKRSPVAGPPPPDQDDKRALQEGPAELLLGQHA